MHKPIEVGVCSSLASNYSLVTLVVDNYSISKCACELIHSKYHDVYYVNDIDNKYIFKVYSFGSMPVKRLNEVLALSDVVNSCRDNLVPRVVKTKGLDSYVSLKYPEGVRIGVLYKYVPGADISHFNKSDSYNYGVSLAHLHSISASGYDIKKRFDASDIACLIDGTSISNAVKERMKNIVKWTQSKRNLLNGLNIGIIHGDLHGGNAVVEQGNVSFIDTDDLRVDYLARDLIALKLTCINHLGSNVYQSVLEGYSSVNGNFSLSLEQECLLLWEREIELLLGYMKRYSKLGISLINDEFVSNRLSHLSNFIKGYKL